VDQKAIDESALYEVNAASIPIIETGKRRIARDRDQSFFPFWCDCSSFCANGNREC